MTTTGTIKGGSFVYRRNESGKGLHDGLLYVNKLGAKDRMVTDKYAVQFEQSHPYPQSHSFLVCKEEHKGDLGTAKGRADESTVGTVYQVVVGQVKQCSCLGFVRHQHCKHVEAMTAIVPMIEEDLNAPWEQYDPREQDGHDEAVLADVAEQDMW